MDSCSRICFIASLILLQFKLNAQSNQTYALTKIFNNKKANALAKDKAIVEKAGEMDFKFETDCGKIQSQFKKGKKLKLQLLNSQSQPCSDLLLGVFEDIRTNLLKTNKITETNDKLIFFAKKDTLLVFQKQQN